MPQTLYHPPVDNPLSLISRTRFDHLIGQHHFNPAIPIAVMLLGGNAQAHPVNYFAGGAWRAGERSTTQLIHLGASLPQQHSISVIAAYWRSLHPRHLIIPFFIL